MNYYAISTCMCSRNVVFNMKTVENVYELFLLEHMQNDVRNAFRYNNAGKTVGIKP